MTNPPQPIDEAELKEKVLDIIEVHYLNIADGLPYTARELAAKSVTFKNTMRLITKVVTAALKRVDETLPDVPNERYSSDEHRIAWLNGKREAHAEAHRAITNGLSKWEAE